jgi:hypothetical protein
MRIIQWFLALVFAVTAGLKIAAILGHSPGAPPTMFSVLPSFLQWTVVASELLLAIWLTSNWKPRLSAFATITLLSIFLCAVIVELTKSNPHDCGCFGKTSFGLVFTLCLDVLLLLGALFLYFRTLSTPSDTIATPTPS